MIMRFRFFEKINTGRLLSILYEALVLAILIMSLAILSGYYATNGFAAEKNLNTSLPKKHYTIPAGSLGKALAVYASEAGVILAFDPAMTDGKSTLGINGEFGLIEGFNGILKNSGLEITNNDKGDYTLKKAPIITAKPSNLPLDIELKEIQVRAKRFYEIGPMPGLGLTKEEIPGNVQSISAKEIKAAHSLSITDLMNSKLQSVNVNDYQSNPFQMDVTYRGFTASPQLGTSQGLSVFLDGIRVNEPFGDVVNWDMIPMNALSSLDVFPGSNPLFGLGTLGGAISMKTKSGFTDTGGTAEVLTGSFGRKQLQGSWGGNNGVVAGFVAANIFDEDGWRKNSPSKVNQLFGKGEWRNDKLQLGLSALYAGNDLIGNGLLPSEAINQDPSNVFTSPDETKNRLLQFQLTSIWDVSDNFNITGQIYRRNSKRNSSTADINQSFGGYATRRPAAGEQVLPGFADINNDGLPDYNAIPFNVAADANGNPLDTNGNPLTVTDNGDGTFTLSGTPLVGSDFNTKAHPNQAMVVGGDGVTLVPNWVFNPLYSSVNINQPVAGVFNTPLPADFYKVAVYNWQNKAMLVNVGKVGTDTNHPSGLGPSYIYDTRQDPTIVIGQYTDSKGFYVFLNTLPIVNESLVRDADGNLKFGRADPENRLGKPQVLYVKDAEGNFIQRDGGLPNASGIGGTGTGYVDGTANAIITTTQINQVSDGAALQFNWNLDKHKFMVGASADMADATYASQQKLGLLDANHNGYLSPDQLAYDYYASANPVSLNDFKGNSITKSLYLSETWSPVSTLNITAAARYNATTIKNTLATNNIIGVVGPNAFINLLDFGQLCTDKNGDGVIDASDCAAGIDGHVIPFGPEQVAGLGGLGPGEKEEFHYYSINPSLGATWQASESLNTYANWNKGARTPSVIELGCAFDDTPVPYIYDKDGITPILYRPRTLSERRFCSLPSTMSGDPYLKQVRSETFETGMRGKWTEDIEWNAAIYRTDLQDDIYYVSYQPERSFFTNIGDTRRQGLELGFKGKSGRARFSLNYALTDATFQSSFKMASPNNSSAGADQFDSTSKTVNNIRQEVSNYQQIQVNPGNRMPGVPLHNINASFSYDVTDKWTVGLSAVFHSSAYVRGNENNQHQVGPATPIHGYCKRQIDSDGDGQIDNQVIEECDMARPDFKYSGKTASYAVFNFQTSYKLDKGLTLGLIINNIFDRQYASAGRLGINPFSPSINGAIDPVSGFNYNSRDWQSSTFLAPGAPRAAWVSLTYDFDADK